MDYLGFFGPNLPRKKSRFYFERYSLRYNKGANNLLPNAIKLLLLPMSLLLLLGGCEGTDNTPRPLYPTDDAPIVKPVPVAFTVIGDVPYSDVQRTRLIDLINTHNKRDPSHFVVHIGDIKLGAVPCKETVYKDVDSILTLFKVPTFIVLGDNEYNDCGDPEQGLEYWKKYFLHFNERWIFEPTVTYQTERNENFSWVMDKVLFIGINLVGGNLHDPAEWNTRLKDNGNWVKKQMEEQKKNVSAAVIFAHANIVELNPGKFNIFTDVFRASSKNFDKPVLYVHGDGHLWFQNKPWAENNISRLQIDGGATAVMITVDTEQEQPFIFDKQFLD